MTAGDDLSEWQRNSVEGLTGILTGDSLKEAVDYIRSCDRNAPPPEFAERIAGMLMAQTKDRQAEDRWPAEWRERIKALHRLAGARRSLKDDSAIVVEMVGAKAKEIVAGVELEEWFVHLEKWVFEILKAHPPDSEIKCVMFALSETMNSFDVSVFGTEDYRGVAEDSDWSDWEPSVFLSGFRGADGLWKKLRDAGEESWAVVVAFMIAITKAFFARRAEDFQRATRLTEPKVTVGFVDGDLFEVDVQWPEATPEKQ